jgi:plastocyanin
LIAKTASGADFFPVAIRFVHGARIGEGSGAPGVLLSMIRHRYATYRRHAGGLVLPLSFALAAVAAVAAVVSVAALAAVAQAHAHVRSGPGRAHRHAPRAARRAVHAPAPASGLRASRLGAPRPAASGPAAPGLAALSARARRSLGAHRLPVHRAVVRVHMAGDPPVSIVDYSFSPGTTTVHVGDTITWTNTGKQPHSATANDHSFDTGILRNGQSATHTFSAAGTFTYFCIVHPYMHGTVVVLAAAKATTTTPTSTTATTTTPSTTTTTPTSTTTPAGQLPLTGADEVAAFAVGLLLLGAGIGLRARMRTRAEDEA